MLCFLPPPLSIFIPDTIYLCLSVRLSTVRRREAVVAEWVRKNTDTDGEGAQINDGCALRYRAEKGPPVIEIEKAKVAGSEALAESIRTKSCRLVSILCVRLRRTGWDKIRRVGILCFCVSCCTAIVPRPSNYFSLRGGAVIYVSVPRGPNSRNDVPSSLPSVLASPFIVFLHELGRWNRGRKAGGLGEFVFPHNARRRRDDAPQVAHSPNAVCQKADDVQCTHVLSTFLATIILTH